MPFSIGVEYGIICLEMGGLWRSFTNLAYGALYLWSVLVSIAFFLASGSCYASKLADSIRWCDGTWDASGAPKGSLLTCNAGWWGARTYTGVTYTYEVAPTDPADVKGRDKKKFGNKLLGGYCQYNAFDAMPFVGAAEGRPIVAVFDFKRPCLFSEIDVVSRRMTNAAISVSISDDGSTWNEAQKGVARSAVTRVRLAPSAMGRYVRLSVLAKSGRTFIDSVLAWGEAEVSELYPEYVADIPCGDALNFPDVVGDGIAILPMDAPHLDAESKPKGNAPESISLKMARNESESRYFAVVNCGNRERKVSLSATGFGGGVSSELLVGGVMRMTRAAKPLTDREMILMMTTNRYYRGSADASDFDVLPFFSAGNVPTASFVRRYLANAAQVSGFPRAVPLASGEGCVVMLRVTSSDAKVGLCNGKINADGVSLPIDVDVVDLTLPGLKMWNYAYEPFTMQFPFESRVRMERDVERYAATGANTTRFLPVPGTKEEMFFRRVPSATVGGEDWCDKDVRDKVRKGNFDGTDAAEVGKIEESAHALVRRCREIGLPDGRCVAFLCDEPFLHNATSILKQAECVRRAEPNLPIHCDPCFWKGKGFAPDDDIAACLENGYNDLVDISCPHYEMLHRRGLRKYWFGSHKVKATYRHPACRFTPAEMADIYASGLNGYAWYCYYYPNATDPWDIDTYWALGFDYSPVFPLENDVAVTPQYESLRECSETVRMLQAIKASGRHELLKAAIGKIRGSVDRTRHFMHKSIARGRPDFLAVRDEILSQFK